MLQKVHDYIQQQKLFEKNDRVLLAVSGGIDSMVMIHVFQQMGIAIGAAHANFQLRGEASDQDELFVADYCKKWHISFYNNRFDTNNYAIAHGISIQMAARELRYRWFNELLDKYGFSCVATAHQINDSLETSILNLSRGTGHLGITGISPKYGKIVRPFLGVTRAEIDQYAADFSITWREDGSNQTDDYARNLIRHKVVPVLKQLNPSLENAFTDFSNRMSGVHELVQLGVQRWKSVYWLDNGERVEIIKKGFSEFTNPASVLYELIKEFGFNLKQCNEVIRAAEGQSGKIFYSSSYQLIIDRSNLLITPISGKMPNISIASSAEEMKWKNQRLIFRNQNGITPIRDRNIAFLDSDKVQWPLIWRTWIEGDYFYPLGMTHKKKLSDYFIDEKISIADKTRITVLESGGDIVWVVGQRIDDRYKITDATQKALVIECFMDS